MLPHDLITCLRNASGARLSQVALPNSAQNLAILGLLVRHGFLSSVHRGTAAASDPAAYEAAPVSQRRLWATLKFREDRPVLSSVELISKPSKRIAVSRQELFRLLLGRRAQFVRPLRLAEVVLLRRANRKGHESWLDGKEALRRGVGGELVMRVR